MRKLIAISGISLLMQACVAAPKNNSPSNQADSYTDRFSVSAIKQRKEQEFTQKLIELEKMNPKAEAAKAIKNNSIYLLAYQSGRGGNTQIPGLTESQTSNLQCRVLQLDGMGDAIYGENHLRYRVALRKYAAEFNTAMFPRCH